jgi:hypothetical protein
MLRYSVVFTVIPSRWVVVFGEESAVAARREDGRRSAARVESPARRKAIAGVGGDP